MIRIIMPGNLSRIICPKCYCDFTFEKEDVKYQFTDQCCKKPMVECPCCGKAIPVNVLPREEQNEVTDDTEE